LEKKLEDEGEERGVATQPVGTKMRATPSYASTLAKGSWIESSIGDWDRGLRN